MNPHSLRKRAARDLIIDTLFRNRDRGNKNYRLTYPFRDLEVIPEEPKVPYGRSGKVILKNSQPGVRYELLEFPSEDEEPGSGNVVEGPIKGTGEDLLFDTPILTERMHNFGIMGMKYARGGNNKSPVFKTFLFQKVVIETGLNLDIKVHIQEELIDYNAANQLLLTDAQQYVTYELFASGDTDFSTILGLDDSGNGGELLIDMVTFKEDTEIIVRATDQTPGSDLQATLFQTVTIKVRPNTSPGISLKDTFIDYNSPGSIRISESQSSVNYQVQSVSIDDDTLDPVTVNGAAVSEIVQGNDGVLFIPSIALTEDIIVRIIATKIDTVTERIVEGGAVVYDAVSLELDGSLEQQVYPNTGVEVEAVETEVDLNSTTFIRILNPQRGIHYQLRNDTNNSKVGSPEFYNWDRGLEETRLNYDYVIGTYSGSEITLKTSKINAEKTYNILATKAKTGSGKELDTKVTINVK